MKTQPVEVKADPVKGAEPVKAGDATTNVSNDAVVPVKADVVNPATLQKDVVATVTPTVEKDAYGRVTTITDSVGNKTNIEYAPGPNGGPIKVSDASGSTVYKLDPATGVWSSPGAPPFKGTLTVDASGKQTWTDSATQAFKTISPDGSQMIVKADGSRVAVSADHQTTTYYLAPVNGKVTEVSVGPNGTEIKNSEGYLLRQTNGNVLTVFDPKGNVIKETTGTVTIDSKTGMVTISPVEKTANSNPVVPVVLPGTMQYPGTTKDNGTNFYGQPIEVKQPSVPVTVTTGNGGSGGSVAVGPVQATPGPVNLGSGGTLNLSTNTGVAIGSANGNVVLGTTNNGHGNTTTNSTATPITTSQTNTQGTNNATGTNVTGNNTTGTITTGNNTTGNNTTGNNTTGNNTTGNNTTANNTTANNNTTASQTLNSTTATGTVASLPTNVVTKDPSGSLSNTSTSGTLTNNSGTNAAGNTTTGNTTTGNNNQTAASVINSNSGNSANNSLSLNSAGNNVNALPTVTVTGKDPGATGAITPRLPALVPSLMHLAITPETTTAEPAIRATPIQAIQTLELVQQ